MDHTAPTEGEVRAALLVVLATSATRGDLVEELWIPQTNERVDVALVDSLLRAFEIKSERDRLGRLPRQIGAYGRIFDECTIVLAERHLAAALGMIPPWWGVWTIAEGNPVRFEQLRSPGRNPSLDSQTLVRLLWREELRHVLTHLGMPPPATAGRPWMWEALLAQLDEHDLRRTVTRVLLQRDPASARIRTRRFLTPRSAVVE